eukprot:TRINITY_DN19833_c0_g1_i1.p1 TRINITY_DN19833_c0_g1~~TRINITY_DN19833_c0_g1_i1.p1  ORF type:complete len:555 (-),score=89.59 TRINITY_DN19833_c0_g1_i1:310-1974(-)
MHGGRGQGDGSDCPDSRDPGEYAFLRKACMVIQEFDQDGQAVIPIEAWHDVLDDLGVEADGDAAMFLADHLHGVGGGMITYKPLLEALGVQLQPDVQQQNERPTTPRSRVSPSAADDPPYERRYGGPPAVSPGAPDDESAYEGSVAAPGRYPPLDLEEAPRANGSYQYQPANNLTPRQHEQMAARGRGHSGDGASMMDSPDRRSYQEAPPLSAASLPQEYFEDWQTYWARRGPVIQRLFQNWDSNMLSNEKFTEQLQEILGDRVDIRSPESNFQQLANKHRTARNMKFAALTSALRRDARATEGNDFGEIGTASYAGSTYAASEVGSEAASHAAGRPTGALQHPSSLPDRGRKHYRGTGSLLSSGDSDAGGYAPSVRSNASRDADEASVAGSARGSVVGSEAGSQAHGAPSGSLIYRGRGRPQSGHQQRQPAPFACGGSYSEGYGGRLDPIPEPSMASLPPTQAVLRQRQLEQDYWVRKTSTADRSETMSEYGSEADLQRTMHTDRNNRGHGDILSWGSSSSRALTPDRKHGRHIAMDGSGRPQACAVRGIFPQ